MAKKGTTPWNKGKNMSEEQKEKLRAKALLRPPTMLGKTHSDNTKEKIRTARAKQVITPESVQKAIQTKRDNGYDLAIFRGKTHSEESKVKIREASKHTAEGKFQRSLEKSKVELAKQNITVLNATVGIPTVELVCNTCKNSFSFTRQYTIGKKLRADLCPICHPRDIASSSAEKDLYNWIQSLGCIAESNDRKLIYPLELDIVLPEYNIAIEYCGLYWHSELNGKHKTYHLHKTEQCAALGIHLITIFEDEWINKQEVVKSRLTNLLKKTDIKLHARKCIVSEIDSKTANNFLNQNHIQESGRSNIRYGAFYNDELVSVMTFSKGNISRKNAEWELDRFSSKLNTNVRGIASKLFAKFVNDHKPTKIITFADRRWSSIGFYVNLGFKFTHNTPPNYWYFNHGHVARIHRYSLKKNSTDNPALTEWENRQEQGWDRIWDCGSIKFVWEILPHKQAQ